VKDYVFAIVVIEIRETFYEVGPKGKIPMGLHAK
jgi:hypothetical protein